MRTKTLSDRNQIFQTNLQVLHFKGQLCFCQQIFCKGSNQMSFIQPVPGWQNCISENWRLNCARHSPLSHTLMLLNSKLTKLTPLQVTHPLCILYTFPGPFTRCVWVNFRIISFSMASSRNLIKLKVTSSQHPKHLNILPSLLNVLCWCCICFDCQTCKTLQPSPSPACISHPWPAGHMWRGSDITGPAPSLIMWCHNFQNKHQPGQRLYDSHLMEPRPSLTQWPIRGLY